MKKRPIADETQRKHLKEHYDKTTNRAAELIRKVRETVNQLEQEIRDLDKPDFIEKVEKRPAESGGALWLRETRETMKQR